MSAKGHDPRLANCVKPVVEQLETRTLMTVTITEIEDSSGIPALFIRGNSANDTLLINDDPESGTVQIIANGQVRTYGPDEDTDGDGDIDGEDDGEIEVFDVDLGGGTDSITYTLDDQYVENDRSFHLDGGSGNDRIFINQDEGAFQNAELDVLIDGDSGNDTITVNLPYLVDSKLDLDVLAADGNDIVNIDVSDYLEGAYTASHLFIDVDLGSGNNLLNVIGEADAYYDSVFDLDVKGGNSTGSLRDTVNITLPTYLNGKAFIDVSLGAGDDRLNITGDVYAYMFEGVTELPYEEVAYAYTYGTPVLAVNVNGGTGHDQLNVTSSTVFLDSTALVSFQIKGNDGNDRINVNLGGAFADDETTDGDADGIDVEQGGKLIVNLDGQNGNDIVNGTFVVDDTEQEFGRGGIGGGSLDIALKGGQQLDSMSLRVIVSSATQPTFGPMGYILLDGQSNTDRATINVGDLRDDGFVKVRNIENLTVL